MCTGIYFDLGPKVSHICHGLNLKEIGILSICFSLWYDTFALLNLTEFSKLGEIYKKTVKNKHTKIEVLSNYVTIGKE